jgi:hypothetical protein
MRAIPSAVLIVSVAQNTGIKIVVEGEWCR